MAPFIDESISNEYIIYSAYVRSMKIMFHAHTHAHAHAHLQPAGNNKPYMNTYTYNG